MSFSVAEILSWTGGRLANAAALGKGIVEEIRVENLSPLGSSRAKDVGFFFSRNYERELPSAQAGVLITGEPFVKPLEASGLPLWKKAAVVACLDPYLAMAVLSEKFASKSSSVAHLPGVSLGTKPEIHPSALVDPTAEIGPGVKIGPYCVVEQYVKIGAGTVLYPGVFIGQRSVVGQDCVLFPRVTLYEWTELGNRVRLHAGVVLGADGFGYAPRVNPAGQVSGHQKIYHLGRVVIGDDVEIGANACVDRSTFGETRISKNSKLDNMVHVGHNARLDEGAILCGGTFLAGNAHIGKYAYIGGLTGVDNHVYVGDGAKVGACSLITKDVPPGDVAVGNPQRGHKEHFRAHALLNRLISERRRK